MTLAQLGRYQITGTLGQGAMGTVYRAYDPLIDRTVAIKTVSCAGLSREESEAFEQSFYREAKSAGRLNHPNIVTIHDVGRSGDLAYTAMEFLAGRSLREILDSGVVLPLERIAKIAIEIADGLAFAHANDVVHRDIKPANIMVLDNNTVKIADFGVALLPNSAHTLMGTAFGSPKYMSPEQVTGKKADGRSDIFSLGVVLYEMLTGRPPFTGESLNEVLDQVLHSAPPLPSSFNPDLPHGFDRIVARAMAKDPDKRYQKANDMAAHLRKYRRIVIQTRREQAQNAEILRAATAIPVATGPGAETVQIKTIQKPVPSPSPPANTRVLRYAVPLAVVLILLAITAGWLLRRPAPDQPTATVAVSAPAPTTTSTTLPAPAVVMPEATPVASAPSASPEAVAAAPESAAPAPEAKPVVEPEPAPKPVAVPEGRIRLAVAPWGEVYVDGKKMGISPPLNALRLPAGKHRIEIRNANFRPFRQSVDLTPDGTIRIKHKFE
ncbi:MAG: Protein kinase [Proteobacteria bacterium]|nr:Protein kinase [Pseudomonadota bacterium]